MQQDTYHDDDVCLVWMNTEQKRELRPAKIDSPRGKSNPVNHRGSAESSESSSESSAESSAVISAESGDDSRADSIEYGAPAESTAESTAESRADSIEYGPPYGWGPSDMEPKQEVEEHVEQLAPGEFFVESILNRRKTKGKEQYLVKWLYHDKASDNTWEPGNGLPQQLVEDYNKKFPLHRA